MDRFWLQGVRYYQQGRKCSKANCKCQDGELHGPYWYARDETAKVRYLGRELPPEIAEKRAAYNRLFQRMERDRARLSRELDALNRLLLCRDPLNPVEIDILRYMGYKDCLVYTGGRQAAQDNPPGAASPVVS